MADTNKDKQYHDPGQDRFEKTDASYKVIATWMGVIVLLLLTVAFAVWGYFNYFAKVRMEEALARRSPLLPQGEVAQQIPGPVLQVNPAARMRQFLKEEDDALASYNWVSNKEAGILRIPIDVATSKVLTSGLLKSRTQNPETTATVPDDGASMPQDSSSGRTFWNLQR